MPPKNKKAERLEKILGAFMEGGVSPEEMMQAVDALMSIIKQSEKLLLAKISENGDNKSVEIRQLESKLNSVSSQLANLVQKVKDDASLDASEIKQLIAREIKRLEQSIPEIPESEMYDDSELRTSLTEHKTLLDSLSILVVGENIRNALESLPDGEKQSIDSIQDLREELDKRQAEERGHATAIIARRLDQILDVSIEGATTGQVLTRKADGTYDFQTPGAGTGITVEIPVGAVNASNTVFTVSAAPKWVVADGTTYFANAGYTYAALTVTMDVAPSFSIRAII